MIPPKGQKFPVLVTAATQAQLDHPSFPMVLANWKARVMRVRVLIPASATIDEKSAGSLYVRMKSDRISLRDVVEWTVKSLDSGHDVAVVCDPLIVFHAATLQMLAPAFRSKRNLGAAWVATSNALRIDRRGQGEDVEGDCMRWFAGGDNVWRTFFTNPEYLPDSIPFVAPLWSGYMAGFCQRRVIPSHYFDITNMRAVGSAMPPLGDYDPTGFAYFAMNTPAKRYSELVEAEA